MDGKNQESSHRLRNAFIRRAPYAGDNDECRRMATDVHELKGLLGAGSFGSDFKEESADDVPKGVLDVWAEVRSRSLQFNSASTTLQHLPRGTVHTCCAIDKGDGSRYSGGVWDELARTSIGTGYGKPADGDGFRTSVLYAYYTDAFELSSALAVYLFSWMIVTAPLCPPRSSSASAVFLSRLCFPPVVRAVRKATIHTAITSLRKSASFIALFGCLSVTFMLLACSELSASSGKATISVKYVFSPLLLSASSHLPSLARGAFGIITAFITYYVGLSAHQRYCTPNRRILVP
ncbi:hypothetical protein ARMSODRAFT_973558 [Armillaria solidipes]|uniref:Uncharacterized protein n=1 Tax=Armillaria solidipes TaxID=1076256 RepID=A0A2H3C2M2_9AGAR|nr:hypothetical protein ARMSODRAFT_973558 [Armillaria solidipes]